MSQKTRFKLKDCAVYIGNQSKYKNSDIIINRLLGPGVIWDYEVETFDGQHLFVEDKELQTYAEYYQFPWSIENTMTDEPPEIPKQCACGAKHNRGFEEFHSFYCPLYKETL